MSDTLLRDAQGCLLAPAITAEGAVKLRRDLGMTKAVFANEFKLPLYLVEAWEKQVRGPTLASRIADYLGVGRSRQPTVPPAMPGHAPSP